MHNFVSMHVRDSLEYDVNNTTRSALGKSALHEPIKEFATVRFFKHEVKFVLGLEPVD